MNNTLSYPDSNTGRELQLNGNSSYQLADQQVQIHVDEIANNRQLGNLSGTLALELWALPEPYRGTGFSGQALAAAQLNPVAGQYCLRDSSFQLDFQAPSPGSWWLCLMLREWEAGQFITRDYINFANPYVVAAGKSSERAVRSNFDNVIEVAFREPETGDASKTELASKPATQVLESKAATTREPEAKVAQAKAPASKVPELKGPATKPAARAKSVKYEAAAAVGAVSVNRASCDQLHAVKGINKKLAQAIVDGRPYKALDDLLAVKGMGKKTLKQIENLISL
ncbi:helix-hairpin-helix domain-containing protein [Halioxenophilus sp. WMMB6]|uniref:ComEA family DNA-binding protein n=1 Tax=Halioxenophilus sp. WMMB6 TaxID=3073815 RepID=UPI00295E7FEF|nr:helix-hairpin-helix domain-containing protein [Halioxenophilus sp. WMMB6]